VSNIPVSQAKFGMYDDSYATCKETYATLRIYPENLDPDQVSECLALSPSSIQRRGEARLLSSGNYATKRLNGWFLTSKGIVDSRDVRRHIDWLLDKVEPAALQFGEILTEGARADISCFWVSASGHGGPTLSPSQMGRLAKLQLECWFDLYAAD
jgi:uncharacterized protein DUF4279